MSPEIRLYLQQIEDVRGQIRALIENIPVDDLPEALNWRPIAGSDHATNSLGVMAIHVAGAEHFWLGEVIGGMPTTRDRDSEFQTQIETGREILERLAVVDAETRPILEALTSANLEETRLARGKVHHVRGIILHVINHSALHLGHMQLTYQLWMRRQSKV